MWRLRGWWLLMIAASAGAVVSLLASSLPVLVGSVLVGTASAVAGAIAVRAEKMIEDEGAAPKRLGPRNVRVRDLDDPLALGVHLAPPVTLPDGTVDLVPGFVRRDASAELEDALRTSRFVLVVGESTAGKSRAAYEAMRACLPAHVFIRPTGREDLPEALARAERQRRCVVWLDELDLYLGVNGLTAPALSPLFTDPGRHRVVLATMRSHERARYSPRNGASPDSGEAQHNRLAGDVLRLATEIRIERLWSAGERARAADESDDRRVLRALDHADRYGVGQFLAAGPQLFQDWRDAWGSWPEGRPRGAALVSAAVDLRRAGLQQAVPIDLLRELHEHYLPAAVRSEPWEEALRWATQPLHSTSSLLVPVGDDHYQAFDYLPDAYDDALGWPAVRDEIWRALTSFVPPADAITIAWAAFHRHELGVAEAALGRALEAGHIEAALDFAFMMRDMGRSEEVTGWLSRAVSGAREAGATAEVTVGLKYRLAWWAGERVRGAGDPARALELAREAEAESVRLLGPEHVLTLWCRLTAVRQVGALGRAEEARRLAEEIVDMGTRLFGHDHEVVSSARFEVAVWTVDGGDPRRGIALWQALVVDDLLVAGELGDSLANIEGVMDDVADPALTAELTGWLTALAGRDDITGTIDDVTAMRLHGTVAWWTGGREQGLGDHRLARDMAERLVEAGRGILGAGDKEVLRVEAVLGHQLGRMGDPVAARRLCARVHEDAVRIYGERSTIADFTGNLAEIWTLAD